MSEGAARTNDGATRKRRARANARRCWRVAPESVLIVISADHFECAEGLRRENGAVDASGGMM